MKTATVTELHERLDEYLDVVRGGEAVEIRDDQGRVARLVPAPEVTDASVMQDKIEAAIAAGTLRRGGNGTGKLPDDFLTRRLARFSSGSVLEALLEEREEGW
jgi:antitoxin (DNA-binding transcriptional repressor) of toxin-antitoxin stability system